MRLVLAAALAVALAACGDLRSGTRLTIETGIHPPGICPGTDSMTISIERDGDAAVFVAADGSPAAGIVWPVGFAAWLIEGDTVATIGGAAGAAGGPFRVCSVGERSYS